MIGIIGAMKEEVAAVLELMENVQEKLIQKIPFYEGNLHGKEVVVMKSGAGKVSSAMTTTILLEHYEVEGIINIGTAGGIQEECKVLDVIIATKIAQFDVDFTAFGVRKSFDEVGNTIHSNSAYIHQASKIMNQLEGNHRVFIAPMVTSDQFIYQEKQITEILENYPEAFCADMEAGSIGMVCKHYDIPFIVIRSLSDVATKHDNQVSFEQYVELASKRSAMFCYQFVKEI